MVVTAVGLLQGSSISAHALPFRARVGLGCIEVSGMQTWNPKGVEEVMMHVRVVGDSAARAEPLVSLAMGWRRGLGPGRRGTMQGWFADGVWAE